MGKKATKVTMFKSTDGSLHPTAAECEAHESRLSIKPSVNDLLVRAGHADDSRFTMEDVSSFVSDNADALLKILVPLLPKKTRTPRGASVDLQAAAPAGAAAPVGAAAQDAGTQDAGAQAVGAQGDASEDFGLL